MNTPGDAHEVTARPSLWPVYLAAAIVLVISLRLLTDIAKILIGGYYSGPPHVVAAYAAYALLGVLATWGLVWRRPWGWWSAVVWTVIFVGFAVRSTIPKYIRVYGAVLKWWLSAIAVLVWALVTRRRLFFPERRSL